MVKTNECGVSVLIFAMLVGVFFLFTWLKSASAANNEKYPKRTNCEGITDLYTTDGDIDEAAFKSMAMYDKPNTLNKIGGGYYQCYCKAFSTSTDGADSSNMCATYQQDQYIALALTNTVTALVSAVNIALRMTIQYFVDLIGYDTNSERFAVIMVTSFMSAFINTGIIALLVLADLEYAPPLVSWIPLYNQYSDLQRDWYTSMGSQVVKTMMIQAFMPIVEIVMAVCQTWLKQWMDSGFPCCRKKRPPPVGDEEDVQAVRYTKKTTIFQYLTLYSGPEYLLHSKYSQVLLQIFVTFMYGMFIPMLFVVCLIALINFYIVETAALVYWYRKPPMYDGELDTKANKILLYAPIPMFLLGYWALGNPQMFNNVPPTINFINRPSNTEHTLISGHDGIDQSHLALIMCVYWIIRVLYKRFADCYYASCASREARDRHAREAEEQEEKFLHEVGADEDLPNYFEAIPGHEMKLWYAQELYDRKNLGAKNMSNPMMKKLAATKRQPGGKLLAPGNINYDILTQQNYALAFNYFSIVDRDLDMTDSNPSQQAQWQMSDQITSVLNIDENKGRPKHWKRPMGDTGIMHTGKSLLAKLKVNDKLVAQKTHQKTMRAKTKKLKD